MNATPTHGKHDPIAYTYEADHHCPDCTYKRFGADSDGWIAMQDNGESCVDGEGNPVGALLPWDEWQTFDGENETLGCADCHRVIDTYEPEEK
jgi:hypothetical protein